MNESNGEANQSDDCTCPTCGTTGFDSQRSMKIHHYNAHGESLVEYQNVKCAYCGESAEKHPSDVRRYDVHYCSNQCRAEDEKSQVTLECDNCGESVKRQTSKAGKYNHHFCGVKCNAEWHANELEYPTGQDHGKYERIEVECERAGCNTTRDIRPSRLSRFRFCSPTCAYDHMSGENSPHWKGGSTVTYGRGWNETTREEVRERDGRACQCCGMAESEHTVEYGTKLHVHHIIPARLFDDPQRRNREDNLVSMCVPCHNKWEGIPLKPQ